MISKEEMEKLEEEWKKVREQRIEEGEDIDDVDIEMGDAFKGVTHASNWGKEGMTEEEYKKSFDI